MARENQPSVLALYDEAFHLVRQAPWRASAAYLLGVVPFLLAFIYYWTDMSQSAFANRQIVGESLFVAGLYLWMSCWQCVYAGALRQHLSGERPAKWTPLRIAQLVRTQALLQAIALILMPAAALIAVPLPGVYAFYQHLTAIPVTEEGPGAKQALRTAMRQAGRWQLQNILLVGLLSVVSGVVLINVLLAIVLGPQLLQTLTGVQSVFTRNALGMMNFTLFLIGFALTYLVLDPVMKAAYVIRAFRIDSLESGQDLRTDLGRERRLSITAAAAVAAVLLFSGSAKAEPAKTISPNSLDKSIEQVLQRSEFAWRTPRVEEPQSASANPFVRFTEDVLRTVNRWTRTALRWINRQIEAFFRWLRGEKPPAFPEGRLSAPDPNELRGLMWTLLAIALLASAYVLYRTRRGKSEPISEAKPITLDKVDLASEEVTADQLPEDDWLALAQQCLDQQDLRKATRALYLASLAYLGRRELIRLHKGKSNRDYRNELARRARAYPEVSRLFERQIGAFEQCWYGLHEATREGFEAFRRDLQQMRSHAEQ